MSIDPEVEWVLLEPPLGTALHNRFALVLSEFLVEPLDHLFKCFGTGSELIVNYSTTGAYG